jgi:superfamily II DNA helicase RecQ
LFGGVVCNDRFIQSFEKHYEQEGAQDLTTFLKAQPGSGIIYAHQRKTCDWLASALCDVDVDAVAYHAGKDPAQRARTQADWTDGSLHVVVATIAFGMGVDKPDVRW